MKNFRRSYAAILAFARSFFGASILPHARACGAVAVPGGELAPSATIEERLASAQSNVDSLTQAIIGKDNELVAAQAARDTLSTEAVQLREDLVAAQASVTALTTDLSSARTDLGTATTKLTKAEADVARLESLCLGRGIDPANAVPNSPSPSASDAPTLTRAEFDALNHEARNAFFRNGGKLI